jgi:hypothetical protein
VRSCCTRRVSVKVIPNRTKTLRISQRT